jgi:NitT/TauT family transport system permease protein
MKNKGFYISVIALCAFFVLWEIAARRGVIDTQFIPAFTTVIGESKGMLRDGTLPIHILTSLARLLGGLALALIVGVPLGFLLGGWTPRFTAFIKPLLTNLSLVNPFTLIPVFILLLGMGEVSKVGIIFWVLVFPVLFSTIAGVTQIDPAIIDISRSMGAKGLKVFKDIIIPASISHIFTGLKTSITLGFLVLLSAEMIGAEAGLGWLVFNSQKNYNIPRLYVGILMVAVMGFLLSVSIDKLQRSIVVWKEEISG